MSAEDWIDWSDYYDVEYWMQFQPIYHPAHIRPTQQYTDKFTFNKRRLRTNRQKLVLEGATVLNKKKLEDNKFYIGSTSIFNKGWGHPTEVEAVEHAQRMLSEQPETGEVFIVEIIKVVRRKPIDVDIEEV